jgi:hypothetical protein
MPDDAIQVKRLDWNADVVTRHNFRFVRVVWVLKVARRDLDATRAHNRGYAFRH